MPLDARGPDTSRLSWSLLDLQSHSARRAQRHRYAASSAEEKAGTKRTVRLRPGLPVEDVTHAVHILYRSLTHLHGRGILAHIARIDG